MSVTRATICIFPYGEGSPGGLDGGAISTCPVGGVRLEHSEVHMARLRIARRGYAKSQNDASIGHEKSQKIVPRIMRMNTNPITANASQLGIPMNSRFPMTLPRGISLERLVQKSGNGGDGMSCSPGIFSLCLSDPLIGFCRYSLSLLFLSFFRVFPHEPRNESNPTITDAHIHPRGFFA